MRETMENLTQIAKGIAAAALCLAVIFALWRQPAFGQSGYDHYNKARELFAADPNSQEAVNELVQGVKDNPDNAFLHSMLGELYYNHGDCDRATPELQKSLQLNSGLYDSHTALASCLARSGKYDDAIIQYDIALKLNPDTADTAAIYTNLGLVYSDKGSLQDAESWLQKAIQLAPNSADYYRMLGKTYLDEGKIQQALDTYKQGVSLAPSSAEGHVDLAFLYAKNKQWQDALTEVNTAITLNPANQDYVAQKQKLEQYAKEPEKYASGNLAGFPQELTYKPPAEEIFGYPMPEPPPPGTPPPSELIASGNMPSQNNAQETPQPTQQPQQTNTEQQQQAQQQQPQQNPEQQPPQQQQPAQPQQQPQQTTEQQQQAQQQQPQQNPEQQQPQQQPQTATAQQNQAQQPDDAYSSGYKPKKHVNEDDFIDNKPKLTPEELAASYFKAAKYNITAGKLDSAERDIDRALELYPKRADFVTAKGLLLLKKDDYEGAANLFNAAIELDAAGSSAALNGLGYAQEMQGRHQAADDSFLKAYNADTANGCAAANVAATLARQENCGDDAKKYSDAAIHNGCSRGETYNNMAVCYFLTGNMEQAYSYSAKAVAASPFDETVLENYNFIIKKSGFRAGIIKVVDKKKYPPYYQVANETQDIPLENMMPLVSLDLNGIYLSNWKTKTILIMPYENPRGIRKWNNSPSQIYTQMTIDSFSGSKSKYFKPIATALGREPLYSFDELKNIELLKKLQDTYHPDLIYIAKLDGIPLSEGTDKKYYGLKKRNALQATVTMDTIVLDGKTLLPVISGPITGTGRLPGISQGEAGYKETKNLRDAAFNDYCENVNRALRDFYNLEPQPVKKKLVNVAADKEPHAHEYHW